MANQLATETSPYLLQHADNPVDWYPWGEEALQLAREQDKPILLSIGYAACHWCHVMAHESFEDAITAIYMNQHFINIKVDREERPDLDSIYMGAVVAMTGQGGWPLTMFMTPDGRPFFGGTYFPPRARYNMPSFLQVLQSVVNAWESQRPEIEENASNMAAHIGRGLQFGGEAGPLTPDLFRRALDAIFRTFDPGEGGFGGAPKFPPSMTIEFLLWMNWLNGDEVALQMADRTLEKMALSGMYDQIGGGFARYATDAKWLVPHFEKMLYDNALLARVYLHAWQVTGNPLYERIVTETLDFVIRELRHEQGGFYSSYDADSEGEEGKFYVWSAAEVKDILGSDADLFMRLYDVTEGGNWEGHNILHLPDTLVNLAEKEGIEAVQLSEKMAAARLKLYDVRAQRVWPGLDDKVLTAWNGLMLAAFAEAGRVLQRPDYTAVAVQNARFLREQMRTKDGRLLRTWKAGHAAKYNGYLEDYAYLADGLLALYQTTFSEEWFTWAEELMGVVQGRFADEEGGFFDTSDDHETLLHRPKEVQDNATPSGNAMAVKALLQLSLLTANGEYWDTASEATSAMVEAMRRYPTGFAHWLGNAALLLSEPLEVAIVGDRKTSDTRQLLETVFETFRPNLVVAAGKAGAVPLLDQRHQLDGQATAYVCHRFVCQQPVTTPSDLKIQLGDSHPS